MTKSLKRDHFALDTPPMRKKVVIINARVPHDTGLEDFRANVAPREIVFARQVANIGSIVLAVVAGYSR
jgi:hypothetical protein